MLDTEGVLMRLCKFQTPLLIAAVLISTLYPCLLPAAPACNDLPARVDHQLSFAPYAGDFAVFVARENGYFSELGINVNIIAGTGAAATATNVDQGTVLFGDSSVNAVIVARSKGQKVKSIALWTDGTPQGWGTLNPGIKTPKDFEGHSVGAGPGTGDAILLPVFVKLNGGDFSKVRFVNISPGIYATSLLSGQVDIVPAYLDGSFVTTARIAKMQGKTLYPVSANAHGMDIYQHDLTASDRTIAENPCLVRAFVQASMIGL
jgi:NitT/TauT family transport system substrate-binding protein